MKLKNREKLILFIVMLFLLDSCETADEKREFIHLDQVGFLELLLVTEVGILSDKCNCVYTLTSEIDTLQLLKNQTVKTMKGLDGISNILMRSDAKPLIDGEGVHHWGIVNASRTEALSITFEGKNIDDYIAEYNSFISTIFSSIEQEPFTLKETSPFDIWRSGYWSDRKGKGFSEFAIERTALPTAKLILDGYKYLIYRVTYQNILLFLEKKRLIHKYYQCFLP